MNIIEALKTEKKLRRKEWTRYLEPIHATIGQNKLSYEGVFSPWEPSIHDLLAEDWEVVEEKIEITKTHLFQTLDSVQGTLYSWDQVWNRLKDKSKCG